MLQRLLMSGALACSLSFSAWAQMPETEGMVQTSSSEVDEETEQEAMQDQRFTLYIARHAEKQEGDLDPALTKDGYSRAVGLSQMLRHADIEAIYSTYYRRSMGTALPVARAFNLPIEFYDADDREALLEKVRQQNRNVLIVGHSNTVPEMVTSAGGQPVELSEDDYGDVFQLSIKGDEVITTRLVAPLLKKD
ncbi:SixA phosphatase family protein [Aliidiomarina minuta]|nr:histidine phosphatase family protein [Aliidiomarina minuta]